ncbi:MAG: three-Cys-motif partner protein TcmP [Rickettsiales bacterium]
MIEEFFGKQKVNSRIKTEIVTEYFGIWSGILGNASNGALCYIDLFCGPGTYEDGTESTPLLILRNVVENKPQEFCNRLITIFNDENDTFVTSLKTSATAIPKISRLKRNPQFSNHSVNNALTQYFHQQSIPPSLIFLDPCGYRGLTASLVQALTQNFGCDAIVFFNTSGIYRNVTNPQEDENMNDLFGQDIAQKLRDSFPKISSTHQKEQLLIQSFIETLKKAGIPYVIPFWFKRDNKDATSHHLIFLSRHPLAFEKMKEVMAKKSADFDPKTVPSYYYSDMDKNNPQASLLPTGNTQKTLANLKSWLLQNIKTNGINVQDIIKFHNSSVQNSIENPYTQKNHKDALLELEAEGKITISPPLGKKRSPQKGVLGDGMIITKAGN